MDDKLMTNEVRAIEKPLADFDSTLLNEYFRRITNIDMDDLDSRYENKVLATRRYVMSAVKARIIVSLSGIQDRSATQLHLENGRTIDGEMAVRVMKHAEQMIVLAVSLVGLNEEDIQDFQKISERYFLDSWGSAAIQVVQIWAYNELNGQLDEGMRLTNMWEPGQTQFPISNQRVVFDMLKLQEHGCVLHSSMMLEPIKTKTCILGIVDKETQDLPIPCSFCQFGKSCPLSRVREFPKTPRRARVSRTSKTFLHGADAL